MEKQALIQAARLRNNPEAYRCTKKSKTHRCTQKFIREEELEHQLSLMLREYAITPDTAAQLLDMAERDREDSHGLLRPSGMKSRSNLRP